MTEPIETQSRNWLERVLDLSPFLSSLLTALVVIFAGYMTQFVGNAGFNGGFDYLKLVAWAFTLQVTGVTVLDLAGSLRGAGPAPATTGG